MIDRLISDDVRAFLEQPRFAVMATINKSGTPQLTVMWYALAPDDDTVILNATRGLLKERNLRRDPRMSLCVEDGLRFVTLTGNAALIEDRAQQEREVNLLIAHTLPGGVASRRILAKCGFKHVGDVVDPEDGLVARFERVVSRPG